MITKQVFRSVLLLLVLGSLAIWANREFQKSQASEEASPSEEQIVQNVEGDQVVMTYFISGGRCEMCRKIEALTQETADKDFADAVAEGRLVFRVIDTDEAGMAHYVEDYQLTSKTVVLSHRINGKESEWSNMAKVWDLLGDPEEFRAYLGGQIASYLGS